MAHSSAEFSEPAVTAGRIARPDQVASSRLSEVQAIVDARRWPTVAVDATGWVTATNRAWDRLSEPWTNSLGRRVSFLDVCARAVGASGAYTARARRDAEMAVRSVLAGRRRSHAVEYATAAPAMQRRFVLRVSVLDNGGALISHEPIPQSVRSPDVDHAGVGLADDLRRGLAAGEIEVWFQPVYEIATGRVVEVEALARWRHPEHGVLLPGMFLPTAVEIGLLQELGAGVLRVACASAARWLDERPESPVMVSVNLWAEQLFDPAVSSLVRDSLAASGLPPGLLRVEASETVLMRDVAASIRALRALRECGIRLAVDDFGTGYSSLVSLKRLPVDVVKIDGSLIAGLGGDPSVSVNVAAVVDLMHTLGFAVVAEGVETAEQLRRLAELGCDLAQGEHLGGPTEPDALVLDHRPEVAAGVPESPTPWGVGAETSAVEAMRYLAHELANRLTVIEGLADVARLAADDDERERSLASASQQAALASRVVQLITDAQALDAGTLRVAPSEVGLRRLVEGAIDALGADRGARVICVDVPDVAVVCDEVRIGQVVANLLANAARHTPESTRVHVRAVVAAERLELHVVDDGPGIPAAHVATVFKKFGRADRSKPGSGLGLYLARSIARAHGGELTYRDADGGGAEFILEIPVPVGDAAFAPR